MKKIIGLVMVLLAVFMLASCGEKEKAIKDMTSLEVVEAMGNGTNLGNTMEATGLPIDLPANPTVSDYETLWGQPITTAEMIQGMKDSGFDSLRIPVAWTNSMDIENGDYTIDETYLARVGEIINYAFDADMIVIINDHWDRGWWGMFGSNTESVREDAMELYTSMWTQVANYYKDYSYGLIYESANEELGDRLNDRDIATDSGYLATDAMKYAAVNNINQAFVDTIRATGGNNADRFLLIAGFNTDIAHTIDDQFQMPTDTVENKLIISVHYYTPWNYCGTGGDVLWGSEIDYNDQNEFLEEMTKFTEMGYGVVIGEWGVLARSDGSLKQRTIEFSNNFLNNCDIYGYAPFLWDTSAFYKRTTLSFIDDDLLAFYQSRNNAAYLELSQDDIVTEAESEMATALAAAIVRDEEEGTTVVQGDSYGWIMFNDGAWDVNYSVGDTYNPSSKSTGVVATDVSVTGAGTYTVALDFTGTANGYANGVVFSAVGISYGETNYPGYIINITQILINGEPYTYSGIPYTASDDGVCTRVNLYNQWVSEIPDDARTVNPNLLRYATPEILDALSLGQIYTISVTFNYVAPAA